MILNPTREPVMVVMVFTYQMFMQVSTMRGCLQPFDMSCVLEDLGAYGLRVAGLDPDKPAGSVFHLNWRLYVDLEVRPYGYRSLQEVEPQVEEWYDDDEGSFVYARRPDNVFYAGRYL